MDLKEQYYRWENKWYDFLEKLDNKVPVTRLTDAVDKIVPSFALFIAIVLVLVAAGVMLFVPGLGGGDAQVTFSLRDDSDNAIEGVNLELTYLGEEKTGVTDELGEFLAGIPLGATVRVDASKQGFEGITRTFDVTEMELRFPLILNSLASATRKVITITYPDGSLFDKPATVSFRCANLGITPPSPVQTSTGIAEVTPDPNCGNLLVSVMAGSYKTLSAREIQADSASGTIYLSEFEQEKGNVEVYVTDEDGNELDGLRVTLLSNLGSVKGELTARRGRLYG